MDNKVLLFYLFATCFFVSSHCFTTEPECSCSKFHYEEKLLEKMIRTEIKFEELKKSVEATLNELQQKNKEFIDNTHTAMESVQQESEQFIAESIAMLDNKTKLVDLGLQAIKSATVKVPVVLFTSKTVTDLNLENDEIIIFTEIMYNNGSGYDSNTGVFTAPVGGTYLFTAQLCNFYEKKIVYTIVVNRMVVTSGWEYEYRQQTCFSFQAIVILKASDNVCVKSGSSSSQLYQGGDHWNMFSGVLLHQ